MSGFLSSNPNYPLQIEEWGDFYEGGPLVLLTRGHHDTEVVRDAAGDYLRAEYPDANLAELLGELKGATVVKGWYRRRPERSDDADGAFRYHDADGPGPGAFPYTKVQVA